MDGFENLLLEVLFPLFPVFFVGMWCFVLWFLSIQSGWSKLADSYHSTAPFKGKYLSFQSARMGLISFQSSLEIGIGKKGLFLLPMVLFRWFHKPLLIPWSEIKAKPRKRWMSDGCGLTFSAVPEVSVEVYGRTFKKLKDVLEIETGFQVDR